MNDLEILKAARARIAQGWCKHMRGQTEGGSYRNGFDADTARWCALGAIDGAMGKFCDFGFPLHPILYTVARFIPEPFQEDEPQKTIATFNNNTSQDAVLEIFDHAIASLTSLKPLTRSDSELVADLLAKLVGPIDVETKSEELTW